MVTKINLDITVIPEEKAIRIDYENADYLNIVLRNKRTKKTKKRILKITKNDHVFLNE